MIREKRKWLNYTYFNRNPDFRWNSIHLFSPVKKKIMGMKQIPFPTMVVNVNDEHFTDHWSRSTRYKINRAEKENFTIRRNNDLLPDILNLFDKTALLKGLRGHAVSDFYSRKWIQCSAVFFENKILAGHVWIIDREEKRSLLFVNASYHQDEQNDTSLVGRAHYFLLWQDGIKFRQTGIEIMDLNGYRPDVNDPLLSGVYSWKEGTHGQLEILYHYYPLPLFWLKTFRNMLTG